MKIEVKDLLFGEDGYIIAGGYFIYCLYTVGSKEDWLKDIVWWLRNNPEELSLSTEELDKGVEEQGLEYVLQLDEYWESVNKLLVESLTQHKWLSLKCHRCSTLLGGVEMPTTLEEVPKAFAKLIRTYETQMRLQKEFHEKAIIALLSSNQDENLEEDV